MDKAGIINTITLSLLIFQRYLVRIQILISCSGPETDLLIFSGVVHPVHIAILLQRLAGPECLITDHTAHTDHGHSCDSRENQFFFSKRHEPVPFIS